ncbi:hypothetical protein GH741_18340 [Aquibacillus halophilus]|uniref:Abasic site processing protein n=1 Tax=Aquibacillus halophilus TaxID=930132 RepID=A0A6A8DLH3_9BACI|nr:SOS response-associated peptidase [Aquibacillus halophilus]MRH44609.1 hypothetical protein [Aquibacillus halophilus]
MCGRFTLNASELEILDEYNLEDTIQSHTPRFNIAPGQNILAIIHDGNKRRAGFLKWGLVPFWAKDPKIGYKMINARSETAHEKPSFKNLLASKRCLIIADSFYEWQKSESGKQPKRISLNDRKLFTFAGLWDKWEGDEQSLYTCTILTKQANEFMSPIHDRMPVILPKEKEDQWIEPIKRNPADVHEFLINTSMEQLTSYNVSDIVNSVKNEDEACIKPLTS